jgi:hypothetical protein
MGLEGLTLENLIYLSQVSAHAHLVGLGRSLVRRDARKPDSSGGVT